MGFDPYIHFQGNCRAAMTAYAEIFNGTLQIMPHSVGPEGVQGPELVLHASLVLPDGGLLMAGDFPPGMVGDPQAAVSISHTAPMARARVIFAALAQGGAVIADFAPTFFAEGFGMVKDRFGTHWMITTPPA